MDTIIIILFVVVISLLIYAVTIMKSDGVKCAKNPLNYGARELSRVNRAEFSCSCSLDKPNSPNIFFNSEMFNVDYPETGNYDYEFNFSIINSN